MRPIYDAKFRGEIRKRMSQPSRETVTEISRAKVISRQTLYSWRHLWKRDGELVPASSSSAEAWDASDKLAAVIQAAGLNGADLGAYCRERGLYPQQLARWRQAAEYANGLDAPSMADRNYRKRKRHFGLAVHAVQRIC